MKKKLLVANWKMNTVYDEAMDLLDYYKSHLRLVDKVKIIVCPPSIWLESVSRKLKNSSLEVGAQNIHFLAAGAVTGEISAPMVGKFAKYTLVGHSERKKFFHETDEAISQKVKMALKYELRPIICFGEMTKEEGIDHTLGQVSKAIKGLSKENVKQVAFAYEPIWAIGTGEVATASHARGVIDSARERLAVIYDRETANKIKFLYGGSVNSKNIHTFTDEHTIDGFLVGGASLEPQAFETIYKTLSE